MAMSIRCFFSSISTALRPVRPRIPLHVTGTGLHPLRVTTRDRSLGVKVLGSIPQPVTSARSVNIQRFSTGRSVGQHTSSSSLCTVSSSCSPTPTPFRLSRTWFRSRLQLTQTTRQSLNHPKRFNSTYSRPYTTTPPPQPPPPPQESLSLSARFKKLSREYGKAAVGVYILLSMLDFPFCFLAVRMLGTDRIGHWEERAVSWIKRLEIVQRAFPEWARLKLDADGEMGGGAEAKLSDLEEAEAEAKEGASIYTELALAYAVHKSFIFIRVPLTAAVTPKVVKVLRGWGWDIGKKRGIRDSAAAASRVRNQAKKKITD